MMRVIALAVALMWLVGSECAEAKSKPWPTPAGELTRQEVIDRFLTGKELDPIEGIWTTDDGQYDIAIIRNTFGDTSGYDFFGVVTDTTIKEWKRGHLKALFKKTANKSTYPGIWFMRDRTPLAVSFKIASTTEIKYVDSIGRPCSLVRVYPSLPDVPDDAGSARVQETVSSGTGFAVRPDLVLTSYHVVGPRSSIQLTANDGTVLKGTIAVKDLANDLALVKTSGGGDPRPLALGKPCEARSGSRVFTVGFPMPGDLGVNVKVSEGIINSVTGLDDDPRMYQISIPVQPGNSGRPLLDTKGNVIGVVAATLNNKYLFFFRETIAQNVNFAVKINYLDNMLSVLAGQPQPVWGTGSTEMDAAQILELVRKSVVLVTAREK